MNDNRTYKDLRRQTQRSRGRSYIIILLLLIFLPRCISSAKGVVANNNEQIETVTERIHIINGEINSKYGHLKEHLKATDKKTVRSVIMLGLQAAEIVTDHEKESAGMNPYFPDEEKEMYPEMKDMIDSNPTDFSSYKIDKYTFYCFNLEKFRKHLTLMEEDDKSITDYMKIDLKYLHQKEAFADAMKARKYYIENAHYVENLLNKHYRVGIKGGFYITSLITSLCDAYFHLIGTLEDITRVEREKHIKQVIGIFTRLSSNDIENASHHAGSFSVNYWNVKSPLPGVSQ